MLLTKMVEVDDARVEALTPEAFRLALEARGWAEVSLTDDVNYERGRVSVLRSTLTHGKPYAIARLADAHHHGSTYDAFVEIERVQALLSAVEAAERGEWDEAAGGAVKVYEGGVMEVCEREAGRVVLREPFVPMMCFAGPDPERRRYVASMARAQLPRLVRIICGVEP